MKRQGIKPRIRPSTGLGGDKDVIGKALHFKRSWIAIAVLVAFDIVFLIPAITTFQQAATEWSRFDDLFDLVAAMFLTAWLLGWSTAPVLMTGILALMLFGREVIKVGPGLVEIFIGLPLVGIAAQYDLSRMRNMRFERPPKKSGKSWRGPHLVFDYGANTVAVGSDLSEAEVAELKSRIEMAGGATIRRGDALPEELQGKWVSPEETLEKETVPEASTAVPVSTPLSLSSPSTLALIIANLVPIAGTVLFGWQLSDVMVLYWAESAVIGFFNLCKIIIIGRWGALLAGPFFVGHFGGFMAVHFLLIYTIFVQGLQNDTNSVGELDNVALLFVALWPALAALFVSHAYSFYTNFIGRREYRGRTVQIQMTEPYSRIIFMHMVLIFGGGLTLVLGGATAVLLIVIALKIWFDIKAHLKQHA